MTTQIITCPVCKKKYKLTTENLSQLSNQVFTCPNCKFTAPFPTVLKGLGGEKPNLTQEMPPLPPTPPGGGGGSHNPTKVNKNPAQQHQVFLTVAGTNSRFILNPGLYILGRKSSDSQATLQLAPDISMSRLHARLSVQIVEGKPMAQIIGLKENNPVIINGKLLPFARPYTLKNGDILQLGRTQCQFTT